MRNVYHKSKAFKEFKQKEFDLSQKQSKIAKLRKEYKSYLIPNSDRMARGY